MEGKIVNYLKVVLKAEHLDTKVEVHFPEIHIVVEEFSEGSYVATCLEYEQSYEDSTVNKSVIGLIEYMFRYFFTVLPKEGRGFLYAQARRDNYPEVWAKIREYIARKHDIDLEFVEKSFSLTGEELEPYKNSLMEERAKSGSMQDMAASLLESKNTLRKQQETIDSLKEEYSALQRETERLREENKVLRSGLTEKRVWEQSRDIEISIPLDFLAYSAAIH